MGNIWARPACEYALNQVGKECGKTNEYSRILDSCHYFNTEKNGYADSCSIFVNACVLLGGCTDPTADEDLDCAKWTALYAMCEPQDGSNAAAGCTQAASYFKNAGQWSDDNPERGDQVFYQKSNGQIYHTGILVNWDWDNDILEVVEGNTNGGMVALKTYSFKDIGGKIAGFGRPRYDGWEPAKAEKPKEDPKPEPKPAPSAPKGKKYTVSVNTHLNVRHGAGSGYPVVDKLYNGEEVTVYEEQNGFGRISEDMDIWVSMKYLV